MRSITAIASCALLALPLVSLSAPARADSNDFMDQAKKFLNNDNNNSNDRNAYERGREDELRRQQAAQDRNAYRPGHDRSRDDRYRDPNVRYDDR
jgi:Ni/Co efflux regulator RcnB